MGRSSGFEVIILAGGKGSRLGELSSVKDKALLPIGNHPMIYYSLKLVEAAGFTGT
jgi:NDP-sugar pyrophosphorylase family protein